MRRVFGVGINDRTGWTNGTRYQVKVYNTWKAMLMRCYSSNYIAKNPTYAGCTVCSRWRVFSNFAKDIRNLTGYSSWVAAGDREYALDKDIIIPGNKVYSPDTCCFVPTYINTIDSNRRQNYSYLTNENKKRVVISTDANGVETEYPSVKEAYFAITGKPGNGASIAECARGEIKTSFGRKWRYKE